MHIYRKKKMKGTYLKRNRTYVRMRLKKGTMSEETNIKDTDSKDIASKDPGSKDKNKKEKKPINWKKELISWAAIIVIAFVLALVITEVIIMKAEIVSGSMMPALKKDDHVIGNRLAYLFSDPQRGDVIFFEYPLSYKELYEIDPELTYKKDRALGDTTEQYHKNGEVYVKRIIGLPGEKVEIIEGKVYINDSETPLDEPYLKAKPTGSFGPYYVPEDCYFCLGDNRNASADSRAWDNPIDPETDPDRFRFVHKDKIYAKAALKTPPDMHWVEHYRYENEPVKED